MSSIINLAPKKKTLTYIEALLDHIDNLSEEQKNVNVSLVLLMGESDEGTFFSIAEGSSVTQALGVLELSKMIIVEENLL